MGRISRGRGWFGEPAYAIPEGITYPITILTIIAYRGGIDGEVPLQDIASDFEMYVPHPNAYNICVSALRRIRGKYVKRIKRGKFSCYKITKWGWRYLDWCVKKGRKLPEPYGDTVKEITKEAIEYYFG